MRVAVPGLVFLMVTTAVAFALRLPTQVGDGVRGLPGWARLLGPYAVLAALGAWRLARRGRLRELLRFRPGDPSLGIVSGLALLLLAWLLDKALLPPTSVAHAWALRLFLLAGDASTAAAIGCLLGLAVCDELTWRGLVHAELDELLGPRRGWVAGAALYAAAHAPTLVTLRDDVAGPNPLIVLLALGAGLCWGFLRARSGRLLPAIFSHAAFAYLATQYLERFI
jgi:membrane protease YdiL (CAAX protease family)